MYTTKISSSHGPARMLAAVTPNDAADFPNGCARGLFVSGAGALVVVDSYGNAVPLVSGAGQYHPICVRRVHATGTTATGIVALY